MDHMGYGLIPLVLWVLTVIPVWRILTRLGFAGAWSLLALLPVVNLVMLWVLAYSVWPIDSRGPAA